MVWLVHIWARVSCMACVYCMACVARQTTFFLFPILIIPVLDMESPQRDPRPPHPTHHHPGRSWRHTLRACLPSPDIAHVRSPDIPRIAHPAPSYHLQTSPIHAGPDTEQVCPYRMALSGRTCRSIRPAHATQSRTVLHHRDTDRITSSMPYHAPQRKKAKR